jgi:hypothetical protein
VVLETLALGGVAVWRYAAEAKPAFAPCLASLVRVGKGALRSLRRTTMLSCLFTRLIKSDKEKGGRGRPPSTIPASHRASCLEIHSRFSSAFRLNFITDLLAFI